MKIEGILCRRLRRARLASGMSQAQAARHFGVSASSYRRWENGCVSASSRLTREALRRFTGKNPAAPPRQDADFRRFRQFLEVVAVVWRAADSEKRTAFLNAWHAAILRIVRDWT